MSSEQAAAAPAAPTYGGYTADEIARLLALPGVMLYDEVSSTLDVAHELGQQDVVAGTLVLADAQTAGRGRLGRTWHSEPGRGIWLTLLERPTVGEMLSVLSLRVALALAPALDAFADGPVELKWPNDLYCGGRKLAGILLEARWRGSRLDWLAAGVGINVQAPRGYDAASLTPASRRIDVLRAVVPELRRALGTSGPLTPEELRSFAERDLAVGRACESPTHGRVVGIDAAGALLVETGSGLVAFHGGSLVLAEPPVRA
jgi:BirA family biotin operon repressor/biotin-[acetyl-CoA-carboxylase] ligase